MNTKEREDIRAFLSCVLMDTDECNMLKVHFPLEGEGDSVNAMYQVPGEGWICFETRNGMSWDFDQMEDEWLMACMEALEGIDMSGKCIIKF